MALKPDLTLHDVDTLLRRHLTLDVRNLEPLQGGHFSRAFAFEAAGCALVARFGTGEAGYLKDAYAGERFSNALPVPRTLHVLTVEGLAVAVSERAPGRVLSSFPNTTIEALLPARLDLLDRIAGADVTSTTGYGFWDARGIGGFPSWRAFLTSIIEPCHDGFYAGWHALFDGPLLDRALFERVYAQMTRMAKRLPEVRALVHNDLNLDNVLSDGTRVTGVVDWANALYGDPVYDAAWLNWWSGGALASVLTARFGRWPDYPGGC